MSEKRPQSLESKEGWRINGLRRCYERGSASHANTHIYPGEDGFTLALYGTWVDGIWPTFEEAAKAADEIGASKT